MKKDISRVKSSLHQVLLKPEDILDQAVFENIGLPIGDNKEMDLAHLLAQGRISKNES